MLEFLCYLASQTLRGSLYILFTLTLQRLLRRRLSPRVRALLWAPLLIALLAPNLCVVRVPVSQPLETTVVDALEQARVALVPDAAAEPNFGARRVDGLDVVYVSPSPLETGPFQTVAPPFEEPRSTQDANAWNAPPFNAPSFEFAKQDAAPSDSFASETPEPIAAPGDFAQSNDFAEADDVADSAEETLAPTPAPPLAEETLAETPPLVAVAATPLEPQASSNAREESVPSEIARLETLATPSHARSRWFEFFEIAAFVSVAIWTLGLVGALVYFVRSAFVCRRWIRLAAPLDDDAVLTLYRRCADSLGVAAPPRLATTTDLSSPALLGWRRAAILIPSDYVDTLSQEQLAHILLHELGHFKRGDAATGFLAFVVLATHWFNPFFWLAARSFFATREEACDAIALGSNVLTASNSVAEYARTLCEIAGRRPFVEQAFGAVGFSPTFRSLRRRVDTLGRFGAWGRRAAIACLLASLLASAFATVSLRLDVEPTDEKTSAVRQNARALFALLPDLPQSPVPEIAPNDPIAAVDVETLYQDEADRLFFGHSTEERQTFVSDAVAKIRTARTQGEAEYYAALGDYLIRESAFFWLLAGVDAVVGDVETVPATELDAALARAEKTADPNFRYLAALHRALADAAKLETPERRADYAEPLSAYVRSPFWREQLKSRTCLALQRELETGACFLAEAAAQGNGDAAASLARYIENDSAVDLAPSGFVAEIGRRAGIAEDDLKAKTADERPATVAKVAFLYALAGAEAGSPRAQGLVASYYARGFGVERNAAEALRWGERFYEADVATGDSIYIPPVWYAKETVLLQPVVAKSPNELNTIEANDLRYLAPLVDVLTLPSTYFKDFAKPVALSRRVFLEGNACDVGRAPSNDGPKSRATFLLLAEAALNLEPTPENLELAEKFLRRANIFESRSIFFQAETNDGRVAALDAKQLRGTPGFAETNERLAEAFETGSFGVKDATKARDFRRFAQEFAINEQHGIPAMLYLRLDPKNNVLALASSSSQANAPSVENDERSFVAPQTPEFEATIAPIFAKLEKTLVDAKNGNAAALTARFDEYFDDATDLYPNGRPGSPEVARYKVERLTKEIERLEENAADAETLERLRQTRDSWRRLAAEAPAVATNA